MSKFDADDVARLERMYMSPQIAEQRARTRAVLAARAGEKGLDIGCGVGFLACEIAREVGSTGRVTGIDSSSGMVAAARNRAEREQLADRMKFLVGDAGSLDFPSATFDFAVAVQVYLYVIEIKQALAEAARVLRPGGRMVIVDTDWDSCLWRTSDRERHRRIIEARMRELAQPHLPPELPALLRQVGLTLDRVEVHPIINLRWERQSLSDGLIETTPGIVTRFGIDPVEAEAWVNDLRSRTAEGDYFFSLNRYLFLAKRR